ncbi:MAG TPA: penicillin-insensitive murein endopeptidase [bacterium]|nr:penicillin-insensitive murein endopeptidase [bacterium]
MKAFFVAACSLLGLGSPVFAAEPPESRCFGKPAQGRIEGAWRLPLFGPNFQAYSVLGWALGRSYVHSRVHRVILTAYARLERPDSNFNYIYGETGLEAGGEFWPHVTHQNGLSVDFMVPVRNERGKPVDFPGRVWNRFGYDLEFDAEGRVPGYRIDFEALAEHLFELHRAARREGIGIRLVIFDPALTERLFETRHGPYLAKHVRFLRRPARWRHDEHYHVDFKVPCS